MSAEGKTPLTSGQRRRRTVVNTYMAMIGIGFIGGVVAGFGGETVAPWVVVGAAIVVTAAACAFTLPYWRSIDELARQAHLSAWMWGGSAGMMLAVMAVAAMPVMPPGWIASLSQDEPYELVWLGAAAVAFTSIAGYGVVWLWFWWRRS